VLGLLRYLFYPTRKLTCEQFTCKVLKMSCLKLREGEVIKRMKEWGREKPWGEEAEQGDEMEDKVGYGKWAGNGREKDGSGRGSIASCSQRGGDRRHWMLLCHTSMDLGVPCGDIHLAHFKTWIEWISCFKTTKINYKKFNMFTCNVRNLQHTYKTAYNFALH